MPINVIDAHFLSWLMHDAHLFEMRTAWDDEGTVCVLLICEVNAEEDMTPLHELDVSSRKILVEMRDVWHSSIQLNGNYAPAPVIDNWAVEQSTTLIRAPNDSPVKEYLHHHLTTMSGSSIDVLFGSLWIQEWPS